MNRLWAAVLGGLGFVVVLPTTVLAGAALGVPTVHWSGVALAGAALVPGSHTTTQGSPAELAPQRRAELDSVQHAAIDLPQAGITMTYVSYHRGQVVVQATALGHGLFQDLGSTFGNDVAVAYDPWEGVVSDGMPGEASPSWWSRHQPLATWWLLVTGFPWYLGAVILVELGGVLLWRRRRAAAD